MRDVRQRPIYFISLVTMKLSLIALALPICVVFALIHVATAKPNALAEASMEIVKSISLLNITFHFP